MALLDRVDEQERLDKFGRAMLDDPSNLVRVPRQRHEKITSDFNSIDKKDPLGRRLRDVVKGMDFERRRAVGLKLLRKYAVLKWPLPSRH